VSAASVFSEAKALILSVLAPAILAAACSGSGDGGSPSPVAPAGSLTITITSAGASPKTLTVTAGSQILFINNDAVAHEMHSDPHPEHTDCPELNQVGHLTPGQSRQTGNLTTIRTCGFHDHAEPFNTSLQGSILIR
jgi:plastocyanin